MADISLRIRHILMSFLLCLGIAFIAAFFILVLLCAFLDTDGGGFEFFLIWAIVTVILAVATDTDEHKAKRAEASRQEATARAEAAKPRIIYQVDGCDVYEFGGAQHARHFVRCLNSKTATDNTYTTGGKHKTTHVEEITTEVK